MNHTSLPYPIYVNVLNTMLGMNDAGTTRALWHGVHSREGQVLMCHLMLETGAHWSGMPLHGISSTTCFATPQQCCSWGAMGQRISSTLLWYLQGLRATVDGVGAVHTGIIIDWLDGYALVPAEHKPLNLLCTDDGWYMLMENNRCRFEDAHLIDPSTSHQTQHYRRNTITYWR